MSGASSTDLRNWTVVGDGYTPNNPIFDNLFSTEHVFVIPFFAIISNRTLSCYLQNHSLRDASPYSVTPFPETLS